MSQNSDFLETIYLQFNLVSNPLLKVRFIGVGICHKMIVTMVIDCMKMMCITICMSICMICSRYKSEIQTRKLERGKIRKTYLVKCVTSRFNVSLRSALSSDTSSVILLILSGLKGFSMEMKWEQQIIILKFQFQYSN